MRGVVIHGPRDVRLEERADPTIVEATDAVIRLTATCVCGSDLWSFRGINAVHQPTPMGHEYCGIVEEVGSEVSTLRPGQLLSARSSRRTTPVRSAAPATSPAAGTGS